MNAWEQKVANLATMGDWRWCHFRPMAGPDGRWRTPLAGHPGLPDMILVHPRRGLFTMAELKSGTGRPSPEQRGWLDDLQLTGIDARVWRPEGLGDITTYLLGREASVL
jgi:hypothetical protein